MKKQPKVFLGHMLEAIEKIESYTKGYTKDKFEKDFKTIDAVIRQLEIIGEAAKQVPLSITKDSPISWNKITELRDKLIHDYFGVDVGIVWKTASESIGVLKLFVKDKISTL